MDVAIALDDTGSMGGAIDNVRMELPSIISQAEAASGGDLRLGYLTFKDDVTVHHELTTDLPAVQTSISAALASEGNAQPEASDIAKSNAVNNTGGFSEPWRAVATKVLILITDASPGGTNDVTDPEDIARMSDAALAAKSKGIRVSDVFVPTEGDYAGQAAILREDAETSEGGFITTNPDGTGTADAIKGIIERCGEPPTEGICPALNVQHWDNIVFSIDAPSLARELNLTANSELDIKLLDDPLTVADIKKKVLDFLKAPDNEQVRNAISIHGVEYAIVCSEVPSQATNNTAASSSISATTSSVE
jgi:von Willebrand factor type A domain